MASSTALGKAELSYFRALSKSRQSDRMLSYYSTSVFLCLRNEIIVLRDSNVFGVDVSGMGKLGCGVEQSWDVTVNVGQTCALRSTDKPCAFLSARGADSVLSGLHGEKKLPAFSPLNT